MQLSKIVIIILLTVLTIQCKTNSNQFSIEIQHYGGAAGITTYFIVNDKSFQVDTDCDLEDCKRTTVYKRYLTSEQRDSLLQALVSLRLDTLKSTYKPEGLVFDGLVSSIKVRGSRLPHIDVSIDNVELPATDSLYKIIDRLILKDPQSTPGKAPPWYQKWNKTTPIVVKTKKTDSELQKERYALLNRLLDSADKGADILIVQNGILVPSPSQKNLRKLSPDQLSNAEIMEWEAAKKLYGSSARPITLIINTYDPKYKYSP